MASSNPPCHGMRGVAVVEVVCEAPRGALPVDTAHGTPPATFHKLEVEMLDGRAYVPRGL